METMEISVPDGMAKKEWFSTSEFARGVGVTPNSLQRWIKKHSEFREKYCQDISKSGNKPRWLIFWKGLTVYISQRNSFNGNQAVSAPLTKAKMVVEEKAKEVVAEKANETIQKSKSQISPIQALLATVQNMALLEEKINDQSSRLAVVEHKQVEQDSLLNRVRQFEEESEYLTEYQKQRINERVRAFVIERAKMNHVPFETFHFSRAFRRLHDSMNKRDLYEYRFEDYKKAMDILRDWYVEYKLNW